MNEIYTTNQNKRNVGVYTLEDFYKLLLSIKILLVKNGDTYCQTYLCKVCMDAYRLSNHVQAE